MNFLNIFEDHVANIFGATSAPFSFKKLAKQAAREMEDQTLVVNGVNTAPALYTILVSGDDDQMLAPYYPELSSEVSEFVKAQAEKKSYTFVGEPLVRFMTDPALRSGKFSVFAENVDAPTLGRLYEEERAYQAGLGSNAQSAQQPEMQDSDVHEPEESAVSPAASPMLADARASIPSIEDDSAYNNGFDAYGQAEEPEAFPVPQTLPRDAIAGLGGAAAIANTGAVGTATSVAANMANARTPQVPSMPTAELLDVVTGDIYKIDESPCVIGRERATAHIALRDPNVSRRHAQLIFNSSDWTIEDLNSTNGTLVNNRRVSRCPLRNGDLLTFGLSTFEFRS